MELNVNYISVSELIEHPSQREIYGDTIVDDDFIDNIKERGILQNLLITDGDLFVKQFGKDYKNKYVIIAGHRRVAGAMHANLTEVPCIIKEYSNYDETVLDLISTNKQRKKEKNVLFKEAENYKKLIEIIKASQIKSNIYKDNENHNNTRGEISPQAKLSIENPNVQDIIDMLNSGMRQSEIIAQQLNVSKDDIKRLTVIYSTDYMQEKSDKWEELGADSDEVWQEMQKWFDFRLQYTHNKISLHSAYTQIMELIKNYESKIKPKPKKEKNKVKTISKKLVYVPFYMNMSEEVKAKIIENYKNTETLHYEIRTNCEFDKHATVPNANLFFTLISLDLKDFITCDIVHFEFMEIADELYSKMVEYYSILAHRLNIKINYREHK